VTTLVLGAGVSGRAAVGLLSKLGERFSVYDQRPEAVEGLASEGVSVFSGEWADEMLDGVDMVVASPGLSPAAEPVVAAGRSDIPIVDEIELALRHIDCPVVAVTGTNGKTTVVELITRMLLDSGLAVASAGNIGPAASDVALAPWDCLVLELSSFQLARTTSLSPRVAIVLNLAPDHLDWHESFDAYRAAKARIFGNIDDDGVLIYDIDDEGAAALVSEATCAKIPVSGTTIPVGGFGIGDSALAFGGGEVPLEEVPVADPSYRMDLVAAAVAARHMGASIDAVAGVVRGFEPSAHRRSVVGEWKGVRWINDSKATNPHSSLAAIHSYSSVVLIAGGRNKGLDIAPLAGEPNIRFVIGIGESGGALVDAAKSDRSILAQSMEHAIEVAVGVAHKGDTVLLSPGCASFDMFTNYQERGDVFSVLVRQRMEGAA
jgi:UDP-N-acetylmuramoylalanine--D-glutamate ligase